MRVLVIQPREQLAPFVRRFTVVEAEDETTRVLLPETGMVMGLRYRGEARLLENGSATRLPDASLAGLRGTVRRVCTSAGGGVLLAMLREEEAAAFLPGPLHELFGATAPLDAVLPRGEVESAAARVRDGRSLAERVAAFEEFLLARLALRRRDDLVAAAVRAIRAAPGSIRIRALAARLGISQDRLEKRFRRVVGASPKQLASILRLHRAVDSHRRGASLTRAAAGAGYFDQSHFIREFRAATGEAPQRFFDAGDDC
jgi:AraC-like DNA-binding protein